MHKNLFRGNSNRRPPPISIIDMACSISERSNRELGCGHRTSFLAGYKSAVMESRRLLSVCISTHEPEPMARLSGAKTLAREETSQREHQARHSSNISLCRMLTSMHEPYEVHSNTEQVEQVSLIVQPCPRTGYSPSPHGGMPRRGIRKDDRFRGERCVALPAMTPSMARWRGMRWHHHRPLSLADKNVPVAEERPVTVVSVLPGPGLSR